MDSRRSLPASLASGMDQSSPVVRTRLIAHKNKDVVWSPVKPSKLLQPALRRDVGSILQAKSLPAVLTEDEAQEAVQHQTPSFAACPAVANEDDKKVSRQETGDVASNASTNDKVQGDETPPQNMLSSSSNSSSPGRMAKEDLARKRETVASKPAVQQSGTQKETQNPPKLWSDYQRTTPCLMRSQRNLPESLKPPGTCFPDAVMQSKKNLPEAAKGRQVLWAPSPQIEPMNSDAYSLATLSNDEVDSKMHNPSTRDSRSELARQTCGETCGSLPQHAEPSTLTAQATSGTSSEEAENRVTFGDPPCVTAAHAQAWSPYMNGRLPVPLLRFAELEALNRTKAKSKSPARQPTHHRNILAATSTTLPNLKKHFQQTSSLMHEQEVASLMRSPDTAARKPILLRNPRRSESCDVECRLKSGTAQHGHGARAEPGGYTRTSSDVTPEVGCGKPWRLAPGMRSPLTQVWGTDKGDDTADGGASQSAATSASSSRSSSKDSEHRDGRLARSVSPHRDSEGAVEAEKQLDCNDILQWPQGQSEHQGPCSIPGTLLKDHDSLNFIMKTMELAMAARSPTEERMVMDLLWNFIRHKKSEATM